jgi:hypothetical protein
MSQQTAVEWLFEKMAQTPMTNWYEVRIQALYMEKEQIKNAFENGIVAYDNPDRMNDDINFDAENYYKETYEKDSTHN